MLWPGPGPPPSLLANPALRGGPKRPDSWVARSDSLLYASRAEMSFQTGTLPGETPATKERVTGASALPQRTSALGTRRKVRVLFVNDTARNGGPGRSLFYILKFLDPEVVHRAVLLPRSGVISDLYVKGGVVDELYFEPNLVENPIEPWARPMEDRKSTRLNSSHSQ